MPVVARRVKDESELIAAREDFFSQDFEGAMLRWGDAGYEAGARSHHLLKVKRWSDAEFRVVGVKEGKNTFAGMAIFDCLTDAGVPFSVTSPGNRAQKKKYFQRGDKWIGKLLTVRYSGWTTNKEGSTVPFHPVAVRFHTTI